ncbi:MAG TPA: hypothetical protein VGX25_18965 [Actinophytocola sp.]|uniref:hypothetical protein n=1 Tax=Actinophytocola sp. TaxID=1872138 RepID=UPI002DDD8C17|nr:hypothetical protein [Actinophytocola sp.]HEV2781468.1 hypothetical protein [Actinophytocola sp.]
MTLALTDASRYIAGVLLLTIVTVEFGGNFLLRIHRGQFGFTDFQKAFARAMHAHAGVLVILSLLCLLLSDAAGLTGFFGWTGRLGVPVAAILIPGGFAASALIGTGEITRPNRFVWLIGAGAAALTLGVVSVGIGLLAG